MGAMVRCNGCGLEHEPKADAMCPACGLPVTVDMRDGGPWSAKPVRVALDEAEARFEALKRQRTGVPPWFDKRVGPALIVGVLVALYLVRRLVNWYLAGQ